MKTRATHGQSSPTKKSPSSQKISLRGILQPIVVRRAADEGRYRVLFGAKRLRAAKQASLDVPIVIGSQANDVYSQVAENQKRRGLTLWTWRALSRTAAKRASPTRRSPSGSASPFRCLHTFHVVLHPIEALVPNRVLLCDPAFGGYERFWRKLKTTNASFLV